MPHTVLHLPNFSTLIRAGVFAVRVILLSMLFALCVAVLPVSAQALIQHYNLNIPRQSLDDALKDFARQTGLQIARFSDTIDGRVIVGPISGQLSVDEALKSLLGPSGLRFKIVNERTIAIVTTGSQSSNASGNGSLSSGEETDSAQSIWTRFHLVQTNQATSSNAFTVDSSASRSSSPVSSSDTSGSLPLQEVVVSSRRTEENLQSVPVAVTVLSGEFLDKLNITDVRAIQQFTPNLAVNEEPSGLTDASIYIRGIGNNENSGLAELGVGIYLDGVYIARPAGSIFDLMDLDRVEVLRGPQGTLFGRNTIGGAIQLIRKTPTDDMHVELKSGYGNYDDWYARAHLDTGLIGASPIKASFSYVHHQRDGSFDNTLTPSNQDPGAIRSDTWALLVRGTFGKLTADYAFDYDRRVGAPLFNQVVAATPDVSKYFGQSAALGGPPFQISMTPLSSGQQEGYEGRTESSANVQGQSLTLNYEVTPALTLKSITAYRRFSQDSIFDLSGNGTLRGVVLDPTTFQPSIGDTTLYNGSNTQHQYQISQEFQALGKSGDFSYVGGMYYFYENSTEVAPQALTFVLSGGQAGLNLAPALGDSGDRDSYALFGQTSYIPGGGNLELTAGLRYTSDYETMTLGGDVNPNLTGHASFTNTSWLLSANYKFTPDLMTYARVSTGYRGGGINARVNFINTFEPEKALAFEAGLKAEMFDRRLRTNLALFYTEYRDQQIQEFLAGSGGVTSIVANAGRVNYGGIELEIAAKVTEALTLDGSLGYTDQRYETFLYRDPATDQVINVASEAHLLNTPKFNSHVGAQYVVNFNVGNLETRVDYSYRSTIYYEVLDRLSPFNSYIRSHPDSEVRARIDLSNVQAGTGRLEFGIWGNNLTNQRNVSYGVDFGSLGFATATFEQPRTYGVDVKFNY